MAFIISSLSRNTEYAFYTKVNNNMVRLEKKILIKGGANVADSRTLVTAKGVITEVSDEDLKLLLANVAFKEHLENGFLTIQESGNKYKAQEKAEVLDKKDKSAQLTEEDYKKSGKKAPKKGKVA